jgi:sugar-phosphatase
MPTLDVAATAVLFDMDGTLVDSTAVVERLWRGFCREYDVDPAELIPYSHGRPTVDTVARFLNDATDAERADAVAGLDHAEPTTVDGLTAVAGADELLASLDLPWAVVTSASRALAVLRMTAVALPLPEVMVTADDDLAGKPSPDGYRRAAALLGADVRDCLVIEDSDAGVRAAVASGAQVVVVGGLETPTAHHLPRLPDLRGLTITRR